MLHYYNTVLIFIAVVQGQKLTIVPPEDDYSGTVYLPDEQYCTGTLCLDHATCLEDADCLNASNNWFRPMCTGPVSCLASSESTTPGYCHKSCDTFCETDGDCGDEKYCAGGICLHDATCRGDKDCLHPSNGWSQPDCVGSVTCGDDGSCSKVCDRLCENYKDCGGEQYCGANKCRDYSTCETDIDCVNPSNMWNQPLCIGYDRCIAGSCNRKCGGLCEDQRPPEKCDVSPCKQNGCDEAYSCIDDYCGGCNANHFDAGGNEICTVSITTSDDSDHHVPFKFSEKCLELCPEDIGRDWETSACDSKELNSCSCPYQPDEYCALQCNYPSPTWSLICISSRGDGDDKAPSSIDSPGPPGPPPTRFTPFVTEPECFDRCSGADLVNNGQCDYQKVNGCRCVSERSQYCFFDCMPNGAWAMACQGRPQVPPPSTPAPTNKAPSSIDDPPGPPPTRFTPFVTEPECVDRCSGADLMYNGQCDYQLIDSCRCVSESDPYCFYECMSNGGVWTMVCQGRPQVPPPLTPAPAPAVKVGKQNKKVKRETKATKKGKK